MELLKHCRVIFLLIVIISCNNKTTITSLYDDSDNQQRGMLDAPCFSDRTCNSNLVCNQAGICVLDMNNSHIGKLGFACRAEKLCDEGICNNNNVCSLPSPQTDDGFFYDDISDGHDDIEYDTDSDNQKNLEVGNEHQPCKSDNTCNNNLQCNEQKICIKAEVSLTEMIEISWPSGGKYLIDKTTVTKEQYMAFLASSPAIQTDELCSWNTDYLPTPEDTHWPPPKEKYKFPIGFVDWCDAKAYCEWAGKRLCAGTYSGYADANSDEWYNACSKGGSQMYPYGNDYQSGYCNDSNNGVGDTVEILSMPNCKGSFDGLFDMVGNQWQWTGGIKDDERVVRGGTYDHGSDYSSCYDGTHKTSYPKNSKSNAVGFRCCKDSL